MPPKAKTTPCGDRFAQELGRHNGHPHALLHVSMDMSRAYQKGVRENCRHAQITFDKFHVIAKVNEAVDEVCRNERRRGTNEASAQLKQTRWLWRKNPEKPDRRTTATHGHAGSGDAPNSPSLSNETATAKPLPKPYTAVGLNEACKHGADAPKKWRKHHGEVYSSP